ncbi:MAG: hypothetical protein ACI308_03270 [Muribaculaceae bacterium]
MEKGKKCFVIGNFAEHRAGNLLDAFPPYSQSVAENLCLPSNRVSERALLFGFPSKRALRQHSPTALAHQQLSYWRYSAQAAYFARQYVFCKSKK